MYINFVFVPFLIIIIAIAILLAGGVDNFLGNNEAVVSLGVGYLIGFILPNVLDQGHQPKRMSYWHSKGLMKKLMWISLVTFLFVAIQAIIGFGVNITFMIFVIPFTYWMHLFAHMYIDKRGLKG